MTILSGLQLVATGTLNFTDTTGTGASSWFGLGVTVPAGAITMFNFARFELTNGRTFTLGGQTFTLQGGNIATLNGAPPREMVAIAQAPFSSLIAWSAQSPSSTVTMLGRYSIFRNATSLE